MTGTLIKYWLCGTVGKVKLLRDPESIQWNLRDVGLHYLIIISSSVISPPVKVLTAPVEKDLAGEAWTLICNFSLFFHFRITGSPWKQSRFNPLQWRIQTYSSRSNSTGIGIYHQRQSVKCKKMRSSEMLRQPFKGIWNSNQSTLLLVKVDAPHYISACPCSGLHVWLFLNFPELS